eukprot:CAMPEP_0169083960 /NCGR_PEP_ID=MMETSP1015-20121227/12356_1 /TAXON_ID=342587 /ORGANISM="Karlodinium micrum, Strain CCMP2283" /LENGTH=93 /DNA_ID=CAMNT_0009143917 /DNA_START=154 /DNA_END=435 /DNA_ORIENTATION=+
MAMRESIGDNVQATELAMMLLMSQTGLPVRTNNNVRVSNRGPVMAPRKKEPRSMTEMLPSEEAMEKKTAAFKVAIGVIAFCILATFVSIINAR